MVSKIFCASSSDSSPVPRPSNGNNDVAVIADPIPKLENMPCLTVSIFLPEPTCLPIIPNPWPAVLNIPGIPAWLVKNCPLPMALKNGLDAVVPNVEGKTFAAFGRTYQIGLKFNM